MLITDRSYISSLQTTESVLRKITQFLQKVKRPNPALSKICYSLHIVIVEEIKRKRQRELEVRKK